MKRRLPWHLMLLFLLCLFAFPAGAAFADEATPPEIQGPKDAEKPLTQEELLKKSQNPVEPMITFPIKFTGDFGSEYGDVLGISLQPVVPFDLGEFNLISRTIIPILHMDGKIPGVQRGGNDYSYNDFTDIPGFGPGTNYSATGLGDINQSFFLTPSEPGDFIWGIGPSFMLPTATDSLLGSGMWSMGPTAVGVIQPDPWSVGVLLTQLWSVGGESGRPDVSQFMAEPFITYNLPKGWFLISDMTISANWLAEDDDDVWTVPLGGGFGKMFQLGDIPFTSSVEAYYNVAHPEGAPTWQTVFNISFLFPF